MKKILMTLAAVLCCAMTTVVFTSCGSDDDVRDYNYSITLESPFVSTSGSNTPENWLDDVWKTYANAIGVSSSNFTLHGTESECNDRVIEGCKKAEGNVKDVQDGTAYVTVVVINNTTNQKVYVQRIER